MSSFFRKLSILFGRKRFRSELDEEMAFHRTQTEAELVDSGMSPEQAHFEAMRRLGNEGLLKERTHGVVGFRFETTLQDLRFALRQLRKNPGFALTAIAILALGVGSSVAIFAFVDAALIKPLPYQDPARLVELFEAIPIGPEFHLSYPDYLDWKRENKVFHSLNVFAPEGFMEKTVDGLREADAARVSDGFFKTLGVTPILGRDFYYGEDRPEAARSTLLSYKAWQRRYAGNRNVIGQTVTLDGHPYVIIGVLPKEFSFAPAEPADFWTIERPDGGCEKSRGCHNLFGVARLKDGVSFETAFADIKSIAQQLEKQYPDSNRDQWANMLPLTAKIVGDVRPILLTILCGAGLLLIIGAVNVASLLLVRSESRRREMAVRGALGASPRRLVRQLVTEGLLLAAVGGITGVVLAQLSLRTLTALIPKDMLMSRPYLQNIGLNGRVALFALALVALSAMLFAFTPVSRLRFTRIREGLADGDRGSAGMVWRRFGANLVVIELATAMILLAGAGLLGKSLYRLLHADTGIQSDHIAILRVDAQGDRYSKDEQRVALGREIVRQISALPGVKAVGVTSKLPIEDGDVTTDFHIIGRPYHGEHHEVAWRTVSSGYWAALGTRLLSGRYFTDRDDAASPKVVIVNQTLAREYFPGEDPVGKQITLESTDKNPMLIVGEVFDIQEGQLDAKARGAMYIPYNQNAYPYFSVLVRTTQDEGSMLPSIAATLHGLDPVMAIFDPETMSHKIHDAPSTYLHRSSAWIVGGLAVMALVLGAIGLYSVIAYSVSRRTREIGVRMALGAERAAVSGMVIGEASRLIVVGIAIGLAGSVPAALAMRGLLFGVPAWDAQTLIGVAFVLALIALLASYLPARRAASVSPAEALRAE
ncbi:MAG TPA: ABC transporter permease [Terracidiphilus sp.]|jgi:macrolide transport system ATP-binding/permease protein|nr:ABC transporter permease [Terracidiphilus sp.]